MLDITYHVGQDAVLHWPLVEGYVAQVLPKMQGELVLSDFVTGFDNNQFHLFIGYQDSLVAGCMITEIVAFPQYKVIRVVAASGAGFGKFIKQFMDYIMNWARVNGALYVEAWTSPEMTRYHRRFGSQKVYDIVRFPTGASSCTEQKNLDGGYGIQDIMEVVAAAKIVPRLLKITHPRKPPAEPKSWTKLLRFIIVRHL